MKYFRIEDEIKYHKKRYKLKREIEDMFLNEGYSHIDPPSFESLDNFMPLYKKIKKESMVKVLNGGSDVLVLRHDNTTNIIKNLIPRWEKGMELKLFYNSTVFRNSPNSNIKGIKQLGVEHLGGTDLKADIEVICLALNILNRFSHDFILEISNSKYIDGLFESMNIDEAEKRQLKDLIYRKNRFELVDYTKKSNLPKEILDCLLNIFELQGDILEIVDKAQDYYTNKDMEEALQELVVLRNFIEEEGYLEYVYFDLSMIKELGYYDGVIFKGYYPNYFKDIISGGRYDSFTEYFGQKVPAMGFSLDLDELTKICFRRGGE
ncbi:MAG: ATP phosphoribosyltransferase regulatory subunit [Tissierellia bacterium]|nr:ATP phosphoribosyltransferase regulatory subunit [Tissierellia bacterium]